MQTPEQMQAALIQKSVDNPEFRDQFMADPKSVINKEFGFDVPDKISIKVHQSTADEIHIALPPAATLSDEELEAVSAGYNINCV